MPHEINFCDSVLPEPVRILGLTLRPYSIGSEILLLRQRNPLVILTGEQFSVFTPGSQMQAVRNAVLVCYRSWSENRRPEKWLKLWQWKIRRMDHGQSIIDFLKYRAAGSTFPPSPSEEARRVYSKDDGDRGRLLGAPFLCRLYAFISKLPEREIRQHGPTAWDFPLGFATFLYLTHLENEGANQIENEREAEVRREWEQHLAEVDPERRIA